jgi:hypothetical protein
MKSGSGQTERYDAVVLDLGLPKTETRSSAGLQVCQRRVAALKGLRYFVNATGTSLMAATPACG